MRKSVLSVIILICLSQMPFSASAHSGRTDGNGGHHDYKNKSGLGAYHFHCGEHPAHLHAESVCPYKSVVPYKEKEQKEEKTNLKNKNTNIVGKGLFGLIFAGTIFVIARQKRK